MQILVLYEFEGCPFCRKVREALTDLAIDVHLKPSPKGGRRFRPVVIQQGGKAQFPFLIDPNAGIEIFESDAIIKHLYARYGKRRRPFLLSLGPLSDLMSQLSMIPRLGRGVLVRASRAPAQPLELHGYEASPDSRLIRELLCCLEQPYLMKQSRGVVTGSPSRVPYLKDPNTGSSCYGVTDSLAYLIRQYAISSRAKN